MGTEIMQKYVADFEPPSRLATLMELRAPLDWASLLYRAPQLAVAPKGDGRPVMLIPGYGTDETSMRPLSRYLEYLGYDVYDWAQGRNRGDVEKDIRRVGKRTQEIHDARGKEPVTLIGWSLGGVAAREAARLFESYVREVVTLGTPIIGGPKYTSVGRRFAEQANLDLVCLLFLSDGPAYRETLDAFERFVADYSPDDYFSLKKLTHHPNRAFPNRNRNLALPRSNPIPMPVE